MLFECLNSSMRVFDTGISLLFRTTLDNYFKFCFKRMKLVFFYLSKIVLVLVQHKESCLPCKQNITQTHTCILYRTCNTNSFRQH